MANKDKTWGRHYVEVVTIHRYSGEESPLCILWEDGRRFDVRAEGEPVYARCPRTGGYAMRYDIDVAGAKRQLFRAEGRWFVEVEGPGWDPRRQGYDPWLAWIPE